MRPAWPRHLPIAAGLLAGTLAAPEVAQASFLAGEALDRMADIVAWVIVFVVPLAAIAVFWLIHILPEKVAHKRHHPQLDGIKTLCLLSLVFGGLLWPLAWLWAYTRPAGYKLAYGTDKHDDYFIERGARARAGTLEANEIPGLRAELDAMAARGALPPALQGLREELDRLAAVPAGAATAPRCAPSPVAAAVGEVATPLAAGASDSASPTPGDAGRA